MTKRPEPCRVSQRRLQIEAALGDYPDLPDERLRDLVKWFRHDATAFDVGIIASNPDIHENYRQFRSDHIDPFTLTELAAMAVFALVFMTFMGVALVQ